MTADATKDPFNDELLKDIIPFVEANYRTMGSADARALSGLSMGGIQTLNIGLHNLGTFRYLAVMSSGLDDRAGSRVLLQDRRRQDPEVQLGAEAVLVGLGRNRHRARERSCGHRQVQVARRPHRNPGNARRSHLGELAALPERSGAEAVPMTHGTAAPAVCRAGRRAGYWPVATRITG